MLGMVRGGWSQSRKRYCREWGGLAAIGGGTPLLLLGGGLPRGKRT